MDKKILKNFFNIKYNAKLRKRLTNHDFTILCSNCMGGIISHRLGERFNSPTINLWMSEPDFQKFCLNLSYYRSCKLHFFESAKRYPVAKLGGEG